MEELPSPAREKRMQRILALSTQGYELGMPLSKPLRDGIYELRTKVGKVNYRILYFFHGRNVAVVSHGFTKEKKVPPKEIDRAIKNRALVLKDLEAHTEEWKV